MDHPGAFKNNINSFVPSLVSLTVMFLAPSLKLEYGLLIYKMALYLCIV